MPVQSSSPLKQDYIHEMCQGFTTFVEELPFNLSLKYIFHRMGQRNDAIELEDRFFQSHPAGAIALNILRKSKSTQNSKFHGLAVETTQSMMGLREQRNAIGLITINMDNHSTTESALHEAYHLGWMAIDTARLLQHPKYKTLKSGPLIPKRSPMNFSKATLQADIFSVLVLAGQGYDTMIKHIARERCLDTMLAKTNGRPWHYPFPLAYETTIEAWKNHIDISDRKHHFISTPLTFAASIATTITDEAHQQWWDFCKPAQAMAWHDESPEHILTTAIHTSEDPIIKVTSMLIQKCTDFKLSEDNIDNTKYNAFISEEQNKLYHEKAIEETFELVLAQGLEAQSNQPFIDVANKQNQKLTEGKVFGWCASALQIAARTFEKAQKDLGDEGTKNLLHLEFKGSQQELKYDSLITLGEKIIEKRKNGDVVTIEDVEGIAKNQSFARFIATSVTETIKDPKYQNSLSATKDLNHVYVPDAAPQKPTVQPKMSQPAPAATPNIGGGMMGGGMVGGTQQQQADTAKDTSEEGTKKAE